MNFPYAPAGQQLTDSFTHALRLPLDRLVGTGHEQHHRWLSFSSLANIEDTIKISFAIPALNYQINFIRALTPESLRDTPETPTVYLEFINYELNEVTCISATTGIDLERALSNLQRSFFEPIPIDTEKAPNIEDVVKFLQAFDTVAIAHGAVPLRDMFSMRYAPLRPPPGHPPVPPATLDGN